MKSSHGILFPRVWSFITQTLCITTTNVAEGHECIIIIIIIIVIIIIIIVIIIIVTIIINIIIISSLLLLSLLLLSLLLLSLLFTITTTNTITTVNLDGKQRWLPF